MYECKKSAKTGLIKTVWGIQNVLFGIQLVFRIRILIKPILFKRIWKSFFKNTLNPIKKKNLPTTRICHFLFHTTVQWVQYTYTVVLQARIQRTKIINNFFYLSALSFFAGFGSGHYSNSGSEPWKMSCTV